MLSTAPEGEQPNSSSPSVQYGLTWEPQMSAATAAGSEPGAEAAEARPLRERVGLVVDGSHAAAALGTIEAAEAAGLSQVLMIQLPTAPDTLTIFAAAAARTARIGWAPQIVPTYSRRPLVLALQALALTDVARGRLRLGAGPSHQAFIEGMYGLSSRTAGAPGRVCRGATCRAVGGHGRSSRTVLRNQVSPNGAARHPPLAMTV